LRVANETITEADLHAKIQARLRRQQELEGKNQREADRAVPGAWGEYEIQKKTRGSLERNSCEVHLNSGHERASPLNAMCRVLTASESGFAALRLCGLARRPKAKHWY